MSGRKKKEPRFKPLQEVLYVCLLCGKSQPLECKRGYASCADGSLIELGCNGKTILSVKGDA